MLNFSESGRFLQYMFISISIDINCTFLNSYNKAKQILLRGRMTSFIRSNISSQLQNAIWLVKTRLQLQTPKHRTSGYSGFSGNVHFLELFMFMLYKCSCCCIYVCKPSLAICYNTLHWLALFIN